MTSMTNDLSALTALEVLHIMRSFLHHNNIYACAELKSKRFNILIFLFICTQLFKDVFLYTVTFLSHCDISRSKSIIIRRYEIYNVLFCCSVAVSNIVPERVNKRRVSCHF